MKHIKTSFFSLIIILTGFAFFFQACKSEPEPRKHLGDFPLGEIKDYLYFQPGSQWVYECDSTFELDSQVMEQSQILRFSKSYIDYELLIYKRKSANRKVIYTSDYPNYDIPYNENFERFYSSFITSSESGGKDAIFFYPFDSSKYAFGSANTYYKGYLDSIEVLGKWYNDIRIFETQGAAWPRCSVETWEGARYTIYWSKNIGIVRLFIESQKRGVNTPFNFNWNLKSFQVKQY